MSFETLTLAGALAVVGGIRADDARCIALVSGAPAGEAFALNRWQSDGPAWQFLQDGKFVAMGGISVHAPWYGVVWLVFADGISPHSWRKIIRFANKVLTNARHQLRRIEANVLDDWKQAEKFARAMGFEHEGTRHHAASNGQSVLVFAMMGDSTC